MDYDGVVPVVHKIYIHRYLRKYIESMVLYYNTCVCILYRSMFFPCEAHLPQEP